MHESKSGVSTSSFSGFFFLKVVFFQRGGLLHIHSQESGFRNPRTPVTCTSIFCLKANPKVKPYPHIQVYTPTPLSNKIKFIFGHGLVVTATYTLYHLFNVCFIFAQKSFSKALSYITRSRAPKGTKRLLAKATVLGDPIISSLALSKGISANAANEALVNAQVNCDCNESGFR